MGSKGNVEILLTRCLLPSQVVPTALSGSFPSSIWLMGAGEIEQGAAHPPQVPAPQSHPRHTQILPTPQQKDENEMRNCPGQPCPQTSQIHSSNLSLDIFAKNRKHMTSLEYLLRAKHCAHILSFIEQIGRAWIPESVRPTRPLAGGPPAPQFSHSKLGTMIALTSKFIVRIKLVNTYKVHKTVPGS